MRVRAAPRGATIARMPAGTGVAWLADVPDRERRDGFPQPVIRRKHPVVAMPVLPRRWDEIGQAADARTDGRAGRSSAALLGADFPWTVA